jgi:hypothetical protein
MSQCIRELPENRQFYPLKKQTFRGLCIAACQRTLRAGCDGHWFFRNMDRIDDRGTMDFSPKHPNSVLPHFNKR